MVNKCVAPACNYNYESERKRRKLQPPGERTGIFEFPKHNNEPEKRARWIACVPRENWLPTDTQALHICEKHFQVCDVVTSSTDSNNRRKRKKGSDALSRKRLRDDAVPCIWPGVPSHLSKIVSPRPTTYSSSESRMENVARYQKEVELERIANDTFTLDELHEKEGQLNIPEEVKKIKTAKYTLFLKLCVKDVPKQKVAK